MGVLGEFGAHFTLSVKLGVSAHAWRNVYVCMYDILTE